MFQRTGAFSLTFRLHLFRGGASETKISDPGQPTHRVSGRIIHEWKKPTTMLMTTHNVYIYLCALCWHFFTFCVSIQSVNTA